MQQQKNTNHIFFEELACHLGAGPLVDVAIIHYKDKIYFSKMKKQSIDQKGPSSATVKLIQGLFDQHRDHSFFILRHRIWTTESVGPMNWGMVRLAAKRITQIEVKASSSDKLAQELSQNTLIEVGEAESFLVSTYSFLPESVHTPPLVIETDRIGIGWAQKLGESVQRGDVLHDHNRPIGALLCDVSGVVLSWAVNRAALNKTLHAEVGAIQNFFKQTQALIPKGAKLYVSLKPCHMCAGMLVESCQDPTSIQVIYAEDDKGLQAQNTALDKIGVSRIWLHQTI